MTLEQYFAPKPPQLQTGSRLRHIPYGDEYILARCSADQIVLINLRDGTRWRDPVALDCLAGIDRNLMARLAGNFSDFEIL